MTERTTWLAWFKQSKPSEWISATAALVGATATLCGIIAVYMSGIIDQKRSELEVKRTELTIKNAALEANAARYTEQLARAQKELDHKEQELSSLTSYYAAIASLSRMSPPSPFGDSKEPYISCQLDYAQDQATVRAISASASLPGLARSKRELLVCPQKREFFASMAKLRKVEVLRIEDIVLDRPDVIQLSGMPELFHLHLINCGLTDDMVEGVVFRRLGSLTLSENPITMVPRIEDVTKLTSLDVGQTHVGDDQLAFLLPTLTGCCSLSLNDTAVTDLAIESLHPLGNTEGFSTRVDIHGTRISLEGIKKLVVEKRAQLVGIKPGQFELEAIRRVMQEANRKARVVISPWAQFDRSKNYDEFPEMIPANGGILGKPGEAADPGWYRN